jgi:hypothetical protein
VKKHVGAVAMTASLLLPLGLAQAGQAAAEPAPAVPTTQPTAAYVMPSVTEGTLAKALGAITALSPTTAFRVTPSIKGGEPTQILSPGSWLVCRQSPAAGGKVTAKTNIRLTVERPWNGC